MVSQFPKQRVSFSDKTKDEYEWAKNTMDFILANGVSPTSKDYSRKLSNYQLFNNVINQEDFKRECNPLGLSVDLVSTEIMPYNKTYNKIQVLLGEELRRRLKFKSILINSEGIKSKLEAKNQMLKQILESKLQQTLQSISELYPQDNTEQPPIDLEELESYFSTSYLEAREILSSKILKYLIQSLQVKDKMNDSFKHALITGEEFAYVGVSNNQPVVDILNTLGVFYHKSGDVKFVQDGLFAGYRSYLTSAEILDKYGQDMKQEDIDKIDKDSPLGFPHLDYQNMGFYDDTYGLNSTGSYGDHNMNDHLVQHIEWISQKKVGFIKFQNEFGDVEEEMVSEDFEVPTHATKQTITKEFNRKCIYYTWMINDKPFSLEWSWIPEVWTGTKISHEIYVRLGPKEVQFRSIDDPFKVKLGYHGLVYSAMNAPSIGLMDRMKPFQYLYFVIIDKLRKFIAQDQGKVFHFDVTMVDPTIGLEKTLYYLKELNIDFYNPLQNANQPGWSQRGKVAAASDFSQTQNIAAYIQLLAAIDQQISDVAGVSPQREGQTQANEAVTNAQANIQLSANITEIYFRAHDTLWGEILTSLLQNAQAVYKNKSFIKQFILDDLSLATLEMTPDSLDNSDFGIFISDATKEDEIFNTLQQWGQALIQNDKATFSDMIKLLKTTSTEELEETIEKAEKVRLKQVQQQQEQQSQQQMALQQQAQEFELEKQARDHQNKIQIAEIDSFKFLQDQDSNDNSIPDQLEIEKLRIQAKQTDRKLDIEEEKVKVAKIAARSKAIKS